MIEVEGLTRYYGELAALSDATFRIEDRETVGFLGLNGAGKSTTLGILAGLIAPSAGRVTVDGVDALDAPDSMRRRIGFLPEDPPLYDEMRVDEFLGWVGKIKGLRRSALKRELPRVIETCQLTDVSHRVISELSHGYRKRVGIAQAIIHQPKVVILDEPISGLDPQQIVEMRRVVRALQKTATVLISSHILSEVAHTCDRVLVIHKGRIVAEGSEEELGDRLGRASRVRLLLRGDMTAIDRLLSDSGLVEDYEVEAGDHGVHPVVITLDGDVREDLVKDLVQSGIGIRGMQDAVSELEQIFLQFTRAGAGEASAGATPARSEVQA